MPFARASCTKKKNFRYILLAQYRYVTCALKSNLNINPGPQLLLCTPANLPEVGTRYVHSA